MRLALVAFAATGCYGPAVEPPDGGSRTDSPDAAVSPPVSETDGPLPSGACVQAVGANGDFTCAIVRDGSTWCWGRNEAGQLGRGTQTTAEDVPGPVVAAFAMTSVAAGYNHACAVDEGGSVWCWGDDFRGQLGYSTASPSEAWAPSRAVPGVAGAVEVRAGFLVSCARAAAGEVACWGDNEVGQLAIDRATGMNPDPQLVTALPAATQLAVGGSHACALTTAGEVWCWGSNRYGQLGDDGGLESCQNGVPCRPEPRRVPGLSAVEVAARGDRTCARIADGHVRCWGQNMFGELGDPSVAAPGESTAPVEVANLTGADALTMGKYQGCARHPEGAVSCWGYNGDGEFANRADGSHGAVRAGFTSTVALAAGASHVCARVTDGTLWCSGANGSGQLGIGTSGDSRYAPTATLLGCDGLTASSPAAPRPPGW